jgi:ectoine hydroxylase-related dioxygenase (phytanoyl-CoA dioxygenase family)
MSVSEVAGPKLHPQNRGFVWQDARTSGHRRVSPEQAAQFNRDGFFVYRGAFTPHEIAAVTAAIDPLEAAYTEFVKAQRDGRHRLTDTDAITFTVHIAAKNPVLKAFAAHPAIKDICHDLIGDDVRLYWDQAVYKKPEKPQEFPWHQDNGYTFIEPQQYLTLWIPLVDVDEETGCPWIAPGLHRQGTFEHWKSDIGLVCLDRPERAVPAPAKAGDIVVFSSLAPHRTGPNLKPGFVRKAYILQYAPEGAFSRLLDGETVLHDDPHRQFKILEGGR